MGLGLIARRDNTGLGFQTKAYYDHLKPDKTMVIDLSPLNGNPQNLDWYKGEPVVLGMPRKKDFQRFLQGLDVVLTAETPYGYEMYDIAHSLGVKVANVINWEFFDHHVHPEYPIPDLIIMPSVWYLKEAQMFAKANGIKCVYLHHPVDRDEVPYRQRTTHKFFNIAGTPASHDRNGTFEFLKAYPSGVVTTQSHDLAHRIRREFRHSNVFTDIQTQQQLYSVGDILVLPRKYGGNCLPLNEALASGVPVIMTDISPNNYLLPKEWLVPATTLEYFTPRTRIDIYQPDLSALASKIDWFKEQNISELSKQASDIADTISWTTLLPKWRAELEHLSNSTS